MSAYFDKHVRELFKNWSSVSTYREGRKLHVHLMLDDEFLARRAENKVELLDQLFGDADARNLLRLMKKTKSRTGLKSYGRKR